MVYFIDIYFRGLISFNRLGKFKFGVWKMVDMDNWMLGNPLLLKQTTRDKYKDKIFKGSKYDVESVIDLKKV